VSEPSPSSPTGPVVVTGANGFVGARVCAALVERGATVRAVVRRAGSAPSDVEERVGDFGDAGFTAEVTQGAGAVVTTVHPMGSDAETQRRVGLEGTLVMARAARDAGVGRFVHLSTAAVYDRSPGLGDVHEDSPLATDEAGPYAVVKRDLDAALAEVDGMTRVLLRPPAILGAGETSMWNTLRPAEMRDDPSAREANPDQSFAWVHVDDLVSLAADLASGRLQAGTDLADGPVEGGCTAVNVAAGPATARDYYGTVTRALGVEPVWTDWAPWTGRILSARARGWGWWPRVELAEALEELEAGLRQ
jgi:nucleoside-diphosphate-sugar epimerase